MGTLVSLKKQVERHIRELERIRRFADDLQAIQRFAEEIILPERMSWLHELLEGAQENNHWAHPRRQRKRIVLAFWRDYSQGKITNKNDWIKQYGITWRTFTNWLDQFSYKGLPENFHYSLPPKSYEMIAHEFWHDNSNGKIKNKKAWAELHGISLRTLNKCLKKYPEN